MTSIKIYNAVYFIQTSSFASISDGIYVRKCIVVDSWMDGLCIMHFLISSAKHYLLILLHRTHLLIYIIGTDTITINQHKSSRPLLHVRNMSITCVLHMNYKCMNYMYNTCKHHTCITCV